MLSPFSKDEENEDDDDDVVMVWQTDADGSLSSAWLQFVDIIKCSLSSRGGGRGGGLPREGEKRHKIHVIVFSAYYLLYTRSHEEITFSISTMRQESLSISDPSHILPFIITEPSAPNLSREFIPHGCRFEFHPTYHRTFFAHQGGAALRFVFPTLSPSVDAFGKGVNGRTADGTDE